MFLKNYDIMMIMNNLLSAGNQTPPITEILKLKRTDGGSTNFVFNTQYKYTPFSWFTNGANTNNSLSQGQSNLIVGNGDTPVVYDDYKLDSVLSTTQVQNVSQIENHYIDDTTNSVISEYKKTFTALTDDVVIKEIGVLSGAYYSTGTSSQYYYSYLVYREVLDAPIELLQGANVVITFTRKMPLYQNAPAEYEVTASVE